MHVFASPPLSGRVVAIASGDRGVSQTLRAMRELVALRRKDPVIRATAANIIQFQAERDSIAEINALFRFVQEDIRYTRDVLGVETLHDPLRVLQTRHGDCDDQSTLLAALLESVGYQTRFVVAGYSGDAFEHVYVQVFDRKSGWISLDPTEGGNLGDAPPRPRRVAYERV